MPDSPNIPAIISRQDALNAGAAHYCTGKPCINGHIALRVVKNGRCIECIPIKKREEYLRNKTRYTNYHKKHRIDNIERITKESKNYRQKNKETLKQKARIRYKKDFIKNAERAKKYANKNKEKIAKYQYEYRIKNKEKIIAQKKKYQERNRERLLAKKRAEGKRNLAAYNRRSSEWRKANPERRKAIANRYVKNHPEQYVKAAHIRRARKTGAGGKFTGEDIREINKLQRGKCAICRKKLGKKRHIDHIVPISKGGKSDRRNLQITCPPCNQTKGGKNPIAFMQSLGKLL